MAFLSSTVEINLVKFSVTLKASSAAFCHKKLWVDSQPLSVQIYPVFRREHVFTQSYWWTVNLQQRNGIMSRKSISYSCSRSTWQQNRCIRLPRQRVPITTFQTKTKEGSGKVEAFFKLIPCWNYFPLGVKSYLPLLSQLSVCISSPWAKVPILSGWNRNKDCSPSLPAPSFPAPTPHQSLKNPLLVLVCTSERPARAHNPKSYWKAGKSR